MSQSAHPSLSGQRALVTGGSSGIGAGVARALAHAGAKVAINYVGGSANAEVVAKGIRAQGGEVMVIQADVSVEEQVRSMFATVCDQWGSLDILVNNAGIQDDAPFLEMTAEQWRRVLDVNLTGQFLCSREAVREFARRGVVPEISAAAGKIICMSSVHDTIPWAGHVNYAASKGGVLMFLKSLAQEVAHLKIRVNGISPGAIRTSLNQDAWQTPEAEAALRTLIPYDRVGEPADIGNAAVWLASDAADYLNGTTLYVDGGMSLYPGFREGG